MREHNFDGLDVDWEYPKRADKENFVNLLKELREAFEFEAEETKNQRLELSAAVPVGPDNVRDGYDVPSVSKWLDFINLMAYDFHGKWEKQAGHNAPLFAPSSDSEWRKQLSVSFAAQVIGLLVLRVTHWLSSQQKSSEPDFMNCVSDVDTSGGTEGKTCDRHAYLWKVIYLDQP